MKHLLCPQEFVMSKWGHDSKRFGTIGLVIRTTCNTLCNPDVVLFLFDAVCWVHYFLGSLSCILSKFKSLWNHMYEQPARANNSCFSALTFLVTPLSETLHWVCFHIPAAFQRCSSSPILQICCLCTCWLQKVSVLGENLDIHLSPWKQVLDLALRMDSNSVT